MGKRIRYNMSKPGVRKLVERIRLAQAAELQKDRRTEISNKAIQIFTELANGPDTPATAYLAAIEGPKAWRKVLLLLCLLFCLNARAVDVYYRWTDFNANSATGRKVVQTPLQPFADHNGAILTPTPIAMTNDANGVATFSNTIPGYAYRIQLYTPNGITTRTSGFPSTLTGYVNGRDYLGDFHNMAFYYLYPGSASNNYAGSFTGNGSGLPNIFTTNWVSILNTTPLTKTNFTDLQFLNKGFGNLELGSWGAQADNSLVLGGSGNKASGVWSVIVGGRGGIASGQASFIGNSYPNSGNTALGAGATIVNGVDCSVDTFAQVGFIGNGNDSAVFGTHFSSIVNGDTCINSGAYSFIGGGRLNEIGDDIPTYGGDYSVIVGGSRNTIDAAATNVFIGGGSNNIVTGNRSFIIAGINNTVGGSNSAAIGHDLTVYTNDCVRVGAGNAHSFIIGPTGQTNADPIFVPGMLVHSSTMASIPTLAKGDIYFWSSNGVAYVICSSPTGVLTTNKLGP
jgi:hypothetical protein